MLKDRSRFRIAAVDDAAHTQALVQELICEFRGMRTALEAVVSHLAGALPKVEDPEAQQDRAIGLLHRVGFSRRRVAAALGIPESTMRTEKFAHFNEVLRRGQSMKRGLDVARMRRHTKADE